MPDRNADANAHVIDEFRAGAGRVGGVFAGKQLVLLHHIGPISGREYVTPLVAATDGDAYLVCGTAGGAPRDPAWVGNIEVGPGTTTIEVGGQTLQAQTTVVRPSDSDWARLYEIWATYWPDARTYQTRTSRQFPVIRLLPLTPAA
ncbi:nitroreductase/quinone reductase family protein [Micromonospora sp. CA-240977]|uniref:nitroreductase/quinone reductase family protein n=1 Tax=Micromonospora sp. CA-240977 TaxID=3239957 RepID=UPI003D8CE022